MSGTILFTEQLCGTHCRDCPSIGSERQTRWATTAGRESVSPAEDPRIVHIACYCVDAIPYGLMHVARNRDERGVIGYVGTTLGEHDVNIAGTFNARETIGGEALTVYNLDEDVPDDVAEELLADERITEVREITLDGRE